MRFFRYLFIALILPLGTKAFATGGCGCDNHCGPQRSTFDRFLNERDFDPLYDYINTKRTINLAEKACNLTLSGDVRFDWNHVNEKRLGRLVRGGNYPCDCDPERFCVGRNEFDIEFNLRLDYVCDRAWAVAHVEFDNAAGVWNNDRCCDDDPQGWHGSGDCCCICLKKAYMGYNIWCACNTRFDVELGRRHLYQVFDSQVQFLSRMDGVLLKFSGFFDCVGDYYINMAGFVADYRVDHYPYIVEAGLLNIFDWGFDFKYSFINWKKNGRNICCVKDPLAFRFANSQITGYFNLSPDWLCTPASIFGAYLVNHCNPKTILTNFKSANQAWYAGISVGEVVYEGDWALQVQYQYVEAFSIPNQDVSGIGRGNIFNESFTVSRRGNTNYRGWRLEGLYALTDNLTIDARVEWSRAIDTDIGGNHEFSAFRLETIYAF